MANEIPDRCPFCVHDACTEYSDGSALVELCEKLKKQLDKYINLWDYYKRMLYYEYRNGRCETLSEKIAIALTETAEEFYLNREPAYWRVEDDRRSSKEHKRNE